MAKSTIAVLRRQGGHLPAGHMQRVSASSARSIRGRSHKLAV